ncbi:hypothetical protein BDV12DRAFT_205754 [Aspergillus spectabilis]
MALISPTNLQTLHFASERQITSLHATPSRKYDFVSLDKAEKATIIPARELFDDLPKGDPGSDALPTISECAVHLEMLEAFHTLRNEVTQSKQLDYVFNIHPSPQTVYRKKWVNRKFVIETVPIRDKSFPEKRKVKWKYFLQIAAARFHEWIRVVDDHLKDAEAGITPPNWLLLPPLDVLVIWHAFLLNCDDFKNYCHRKKLVHVQSIVFPWAQIHTAIDSDTCKYNLSEEHSDWLSKSNGINADLVEALSAAWRPKGIVKEMLSAFDDYGLVLGLKKSSEPMFETIKAARDGRLTNRAIVENVERQCVFVDKMHAHRWIRSPAVEGTLRRAVDRYDKFLHLFRLYPNQFLVPTLDVDLAWHTHQCSAANYREFVTTRVRRFINHEDKIGRGTLDGGFTNAEQWYRLRFGEQYQVCLCWSCEAVLSAVEELDEDILDEVDPPISGLVKAVDRRVHYYREAEIARRMGRPAPIWNHKA